VAKQFKKTTVAGTPKRTGLRQPRLNQLAANEDHRAIGKPEIRFVDPMTFFLFHDHRGEVRQKIFVTRTLAQK
jgi:hypothetical protein